MTTELNEKDIAAAAAAVDKEANKKSTKTKKDQHHKEPSSVAGMLAALHKHSGGTNVLKESMKTMRDADGHDKKGDLIVADKMEALEKLLEFAQADQQSSKPKSRRHTKWDFRASPHAHFGKTLEDTFLAFVQWARTNEDEDGSGKQLLQSTMSPRPFVA